MDKSLNKYSISVVIPAYNSEKTIIKCLDSIKNQTLIDTIKEIIVVNDGSKDNTKKIVEDYKRNNKNLNIVLINKQNEGVSAARNDGLKAAKFDWVALLDSDDEWTNNKIEIQLTEISKNKDIDYIGGDFVKEGVKILGKKIKKLYKVNIKDLCLKSFPQTSTVLFKRKIFQTIGGFDETRRYAEDLQFFMKICENYGYYYLPGKVVIYDGDKRGFGVRGLSSNIKEMQKGLMKNLDEVYQRGSISKSYYIFVKIYNKLKYIRRIIISKLQK